VSNNLWAEHAASIKTSAIVCALVMLAACGGKNTESNIPTPGNNESAKTRTLEASAALLQDKTPVASISTYVNGFHFYNGAIEHQMEAHHYCSILNDDVIQCVIYDGNVNDAKLMGVEYIVSAALFDILPDEEKALWHSHVHEVKSGQLIAPGIPDVAEHALMQKLVGTYGKTFHTWHTDRQQNLPLGMPKLMMGFIADGQAKAAMVAARDQRFNVSSEEKRRQRADITPPAIDPGADAWAKGNVIQIADPTTKH
jgi:hypothetical protein